MMPSICGTYSVARGSMVGGSMRSAPMSSCMAAITSSVSARMVMPRWTARAMILSSMSVMLRT
ncbi:hypothetical protein D9M69_621000 [compost metagenome]